MIARGMLLILATAAPFTTISAHETSAGELETQLAALSRRVASLEAELRALKESPTEARPATKPVPGAAPRADGGEPARARVRFSGDFRYRHEAIDLEDLETRQRSRIRARANVTTDVREDMELGFGLATGGDSPTSSTQTLGYGGSKKGIALDLAYMDWTPLDGLHLLAGKFRNPLFKVPSQTLLWDDEWRPEGVAVRYERDRWFATFLGNWLESDTAAPAREWAVGGHAGIHRPLGGARLTAGIGYFDIDTSGKGTFHGGDQGFAGNTVSCADPQDTGTCVYVMDYRELEVFGALDLVGEAYSTKFYGHYLENLDARRFGTGWTLGSRLQTTWRGYPMQFDYFFRSLGADAVYASLTNSDFGGGGSDAEGHYFKAGWSVTDALKLSVTLFDNRVGGDAGQPRDYDRVQLNADFRY